MTFGSVRISVRQMQARARQGRPRPSTRSWGVGVFGPTIRAAVAAIAVFASGCTTTHLRDTTVRTASTLTDLQYQMVLDNLAMMSLNPRVIPWFVKLDGGSVQISDEIAAEAGLLEALALGSIRDSLLGRALILPSRQNTQQWDLVPVIDPKELRGMQAAYRKALGLEIEDEDVLEDLDVPTGWFETGSLGDVPSDAVYVGSYRGRQVWVMPDHVNGLSKFTLVILSVAALDPDERGFNRGITATPD